MNKYRLKPGQEAFVPLSGPMAGRQFQRGHVYDAIPDAEAHRFEPVQKKQSTKPSSPTKTAPAATVGKEKTSSIKEARK